MSWRAEIKAAVGGLDVDVLVEGGPGPTVLVGPNGSGKTTLLRIIAGAYRPASAEIEVGSSVLFSSRRGIDLAIERRRVGYVPQGFGLFPHLDVVGNVAFGLSTARRKRPRRARRALAVEMLDALACGHLAGRAVERLSGGEKQRVALARALLADPAMLLLDEPMAALDVAARRSVRRFLSERLQGLNYPSIVVTHDVRDAEALGAPVCVVERGRVVQTGTVSALRVAPATDFVAEFVGFEPGAVC